MNNNMYDNTDWGNDFLNQYSNNSNTCYSENCTFGFDNDYSRERFPIGYADLSYRMDRMEALLRAMWKKTPRKKARKIRSIRRSTKTKTKATKKFLKQSKNKSLIKMHG